MVLLHPQIGKISKLAASAPNSPISPRSNPGGGGLLAMLLNLLELGVNSVGAGLRILLGLVRRLHHLGLLGQVQNLWRVTKISVEGGPNQGLQPHLLPQDLLNPRPDHQVSRWRTANYITKSPGHQSRRRPNLLVEPCCLLVAQHPPLPQSHYLKPELHFRLLLPELPDHPKFVHQLFQQPAQLQKNLADIHH